MRQSLNRNANGAAVGKSVPSSKKLFETEDLYTGWDGTYMGQKAPSAVYAVIFDLEGYHFEVARRIGSITLVR